ncbi:hypothetical protein ACOME3_000982 [Neoechinorhynchus agilis]
MNFVRHSNILKLPLEIPVKEVKQVEYVPCTLDDIINDTDNVDTLQMFERTELLKPMDRSTSCTNVSNFIAKVQVLKIRQSKIFQQLDTILLNRLTAGSLSDQYSHVLKNEIFMKHPEAWSDITEVEWKLFFRQRRQSNACQVKDQDVLEQSKQSISNIMTVNFDEIIDGLQPDLPKSECKARDRICNPWQRLAYIRLQKENFRYFLHQIESELNRKELPIVGIQDFVSLRQDETHINFGLAIGFTRKSMKISGSDIQRKIKNLFSIKTIKNLGKQNVHKGHIN